MSSSFIPSPHRTGSRVSIALEELGLPYEAHRVTLADADVKSPEFLSLNPNNKIPAIVDPDGPGRRTAAAVRIRRDPDLSRGEDRQADRLDPGRSKYERSAMADVPDGRRRADVRPARFLRQVRRQRDRRSAPARPLHQRGQAPTERAGTRSSTAATGSPATIPSPTSPSRRGCGSLRNTAWMTWSAGLGIRTSWPISIGSSRARRFRRA